MNTPSPQLLYYDIAPEVTAFSTTRHGGVSHGAYGELNINAYCGDDEEHVARNRELLAKKLGLPPTQPSAWGGDTGGGQRFFGIAGRAASLGT